MASRGVESASVSALFVCVVSGLIAVAAFTFEAGRKIDTYAELSILAASTGRVGAQHLSGVRANEVRIDRDEAVRAMDSHLNGLRVSATYVVSESRIQVTLRRDTGAPWVAGLGLVNRRVEVTRSVEIVSG